MSHILKPLTDEEFEKLIEEHNKGGAFKRQQAAAQSCWDAGIVIRKSCGHMAMPKYHIFFEPLADQKIKKLQSYYRSLEWLAYLEGEIDRENSTVIVKDLVMPKSQFVTGVNVHNVEYDWNEGRSIIGVIHSHHNMGAFFSGTDDAYINQNHDVSIVVSTSSRSPILGQVRVKTPCGDYVLAEKENVTFSVKQVQVLDEAEFEKEFVSKINQYTPPVITRYVNGVRQFHGNFHGRFSGNPPRVNVQTSETLLLPFNEDPYAEMSDENTRIELRKYYSEEEINEFFENGEAQEELLIIKQLEADGFNVTVDSEDFEEFEDASIIELSEVDELQESVEGDHQVAYGVPLKDQENEQNVWDLSEDNKIKQSVH